jgi:polysaccharide export outer membrane protein
MNYKILALIGLLVLGSCSTKKEILYFQGIERIEDMEAQGSFEPVFEINDILQIQFSSLNPEVVEPFQMNMGGQSSSSGGGNSGRNSGMIGYLVDIDGNIPFPVLGKVPVAGKSRSELEAFLTEEIRKKYVKDAVVAVRLVNFRVIVLGETGESVVRVENERITVPELIASVGGIPYSAKRDNILVIREIAGERTYGYVDMTTAEVFENPFYYLRQNDIVYVEPTYKTVKSAGWITSFQGLISLGTTIFSLIILFTR